MSASRTGVLPDQRPGKGVPAGTDMAKISLTVELDEDTLRALAALGDPRQVLEVLARSAAGDLVRPQERREETDTSLRAERRLSDDYLSESEARTARAESTSGGACDPEQGTRRDHEDARISAERGSTDHALTGERADTEMVLMHQRDANERLVVATVRAQELAEEAEAAKERAEASERTLREVAEFRELFLGVLSHDLRNPLNAIALAAATLLGRGRLEAKDRETAERINRASTRIARMVAQLLDVTRLRLGGGFPLDRQPVDLGEVCRTVLEEFTGRDTELRTEGDLRGAWDPDRLEELLSNLVGNALEYARPGTAVRVAARGEGPAVSAEVSNQGPAIPPEVLPFIFEAFRRGNPGRKSKSGNLGLGLYIAKQIVLSHQGELDVRCVDGTTTFRVRLPRDGTAH